MSTFRRTIALTSKPQNLSQLASPCDALSALWSLVYTCVGVSVSKADQCHPVGAVGSTREWFYLSRDKKGWKKEVEKRKTLSDQREISQARRRATLEGASGFECSVGHVSGWVFFWFKMAK